MPSLPFPPSGGASSRQIAAESLPGREPSASAAAPARAGGFYPPSPGSHAPVDAASAPAPPLPRAGGTPIRIGDKLVAIDPMTCEAFQAVYGDHSGVR